MGGGSGGLNDWHRQKRKRELQKNKDQRIAARDAKVKETKTVASVRDEIRNLERQYKNPEVRPHNVQSKLDRLQKELKILQQEEENNSSKQTTSQSTQQQYHSTKVWKPLENPALSVYYDAKFNPFGEPPPGKPSLYHTPAGGTTSDLREAGLPGEPRQPTPPNPTHSQSSENRSDMKKLNNSRRPYDQPTSTQRSSEDKKHGSNSRISSSSLPSKKPADAARKVCDVLPPVQRPKRYGKQTVADDIWASGDEFTGAENEIIVTDHVLTNNKKSQGESKSKGDKSAPSISSDQQWQYRDQAGNVQGPFTTEQMKQWIAAGFFPPGQLIRSSATGTWVSLQATPVLRDSLPLSNNTAQQRQREKEKVSSAPSVQDRIEALRKAHARDSQEQEFSSVQDRIAELRKSRDDEREMSLPCRAKSEASSDGAKISVSKERGRSVEETGGFHGGNDGGVQRHTGHRPADYVEETNKAEEPGYVPAHPHHQLSKPNVQDGHLAPRAVLSEIEHGLNSTDLEDMSQIPYPVDEVANRATYMIGDNLDMPPAMYPIHDADMADIPYPVHDEYAGEDEPNSGEIHDVPYPAVEPKQQFSARDDNDETGQAPSCNMEHVTGSYPVVDNYPVVGEFIGDPDDDNAYQLRETKKPKVDKEILSLFPSHLKRGNDSYRAPTKS